MKTLLTFLAFLLPLSAFASFDRDLYFGMRNDADVSALQELLADQNLYTGPITGNFFSLTQKAVKTFQTAHSINPTGYFGTLTRAEANAFIGTVTDESGTPISSTPTAPKTNDDVVTKLAEQLKVLQDQLAQLQQNQQTLVQQNQTLTEQAQTLQDIKTKQVEQATALGAIQQNTTPTPAQVVMQEVKKEIKFPTADRRDVLNVCYEESLDVFMCVIRFEYYEDGKIVNTEITKSSSNNAEFFRESGKDTYFYPVFNPQLGDYKNKLSPDSFGYYMLRTITASVNGVTQSFTKTFFTSIGH